MAEVFSVPASSSLLAEVNQLAPGRSKASDGTVGDRAHAQSVSDHNLDETGNTGGVEDSDHTDEVHARDITSAGPWPAGWSMERIVQLILARCRSGAEKRLRYIIYRRRIWSASSGWVQKAYTGPNPHDKHAHFSFRYGSGSGVSNPENITSPWGLLAADQEDDMPSPQEYAKAVWDYRLTDPRSKAKPAGTMSAGTVQQYRDQVAINQSDRVIEALGNRVSELEQKLDKVIELLTPKP